MASNDSRVTMTDEPMSSSNPLPNKDTGITEQLEQLLSDITGQAAAEHLTWYEQDKRRLAAMQALINSEANRRVIAELEALQEIVVSHHFDTTAGRRIDDEITARIAALTSKEPTDVHPN